MLVMYRIDDPPLCFFCVEPPSLPEITMATVSPDSLKMHAICQRELQILSSCLGDRLLCSHTLYRASISLIMNQYRDRSTTTNIW